MKSLLLFLIGSCLLLPSMAQTVLLEEIPSDSATTQFGPNRRHFVHTYMGFGLLFGQNNEGAKTAVPASSEWHVGMRYKYKLGETVSLGMDLSYALSSYTLRQEDGKVLPDTTTHDKEQLRQEWVEPAFFLRVNTGLRGDQVGRFIDAGIAAPVLVRSSHHTTDELPDGQIREVTTRVLPYMEPLVWKAFVRIGFNNLVFYGSYRLTDLLTPESGYPQLPAMSMGLQLGFH